MAPKEAPKEALFQMRFGAKRLTKVVQKSMSPAKRAIIAKTPFKHLLNVASFAAPPMELIEYVVKHTNPKLREFRHKTRSILFTRDMVVKVLGVPSGNRPMVYLKRTQQSKLRDLFKNNKGRATIAKAIEVLENCADTDEALVVQSFGLIAFATVLCPGTDNLVLSETLYAVVAPADSHRPHVDLAVGGDDGMGSEEVEVNPSASLNEWLEKGLASSQELQFLKAANAKRMAALLVDVHAANVASCSFTIPCPVAPDVHAKDPSPIMVEEDAVVENVVIDQALDIGEASHMARHEPSRVPSPDPSRVASPVPFTEPTEPSHVPSPEYSRVPSAEHTHVPSPEHSRVPSPEHSLVGSPASSEDFEPTIASPSNWPPGFWDDAPSMELFEPGSDDAKFFATIPDIPRKDQSVAAATSGGSSVFVTPVHREDTAQSIGLAVSKFCTHVYITNISVVPILSQSELIKDPTKFQTKDVIVEFKNACDKYKISKMDLLWFPIVHEKHWATCCINLLHSQINSFDSIKPTKKEITNFGALAQETQAFSFDITKLKRGGPADYPQQPNLFDCGFFTTLCMDKFDGKVMENFDENGIPYFCMILATDLIDHPMNTEDSAKVFEEKTYE
ncbi:hypothetical protein ACQ4PT_001097 [Festuca glaucescens]